MKRLLTIGHSYVVAANRRLAHEMAIQGRGDWSVTAVAPIRFRGDLRRIDVEAIADEACALKTVPARFDRSPHLMWYGGVNPMLRDRWDVIHCWEEPYVLAGAQIAHHAPASARLVIATFQNIAKRYPWPLRTFERTAMRRADGWIAFGKTIYDALSPRASYAGRPSRIIPPGVDVAQFRPDAAAARALRARIGWTADDLVVGFLGRFVPQKGLALLTAALRSTEAPWRALFVGGGPLESDLRRFADEYPSRVHIETGVAHQDVPRWLNAMSVLCAPSQTKADWREQFGRMLIEAMSCGVPVIASDSGEIPSVVEDAGLVVGERDLAGWTHAIDRLLGSDGLRRDYAARGRARAESRFAWPVVARAHLAFFDALVDGGTR